MLKKILQWKKYSKDVRFVKFEQYKPHVPTAVRDTFSTSISVQKATQLPPLRPPTILPPLSSNAMLMDINYKGTNYKELNQPAGADSSTSERVDSTILVGEGTQRNSIYDKKPFFPECMFMSIKIQKSLLKSFVLQ